MQCPVCNNEVGPQSAFCNHCGATLTPVAASTATPPTAAYAATPGYSDVPPAAYAPPAAGYAPPTGYAPPAGYATPPAYPGPPAAAGSGGLTATAAAAIAYITFIPAVIFLVLEPYNKIPLVRFHSFQSIALTVVAVALQIIITILQVGLAFTGLGVISLLFGLLHLVLGLGLLLVWILAIMKASKGEWYKIPLIGDFCLKQVQS